MPGLDLGERWFAGAAFVDREGAARVEAAASRHVERVRHDAFDGGELLLIGMQLGDRSEQPAYLTALAAALLRRAQQIRAARRRTSTTKETTDAR